MFWRWRGGRWPLSCKVSIIVYNRWMEVAKVNFMRFTEYGGDTSNICSRWDYWMCFCTIECSWWGTALIERYHSLLKQQRLFVRIWIWMECLQTPQISTDLLNVNCTAEQSTEETLWLLHLYCRSMANSDCYVCISNSFLHSLKNFVTADLWTWGRMKPRTLIFIQT